MSEDLRKQLQTLEEDYVGQPPVVQQADLGEINRIRAELGMSLVDAQLKEVRVAETVKQTATSQSKNKTNVQDHREARRIYEAYLKTIKELKVHQGYAERIVKATKGSGQTPVRPLATMGTNGGALLCDHCGKAILLEGGEFHGITADVAWQRSGPRENWTSFILGGLVVDVKSNGTLRIYHGYPGAGRQYCCDMASREEEKARASSEPKPCPVRFDAMLAFLEAELPQTTEDERADLLRNIMDTMFSFDPGIGRNRPGI